MDEPVLLRIDGAVDQPLALSYNDLRAMPEADQIPDISRFHPSRSGDGVALDSLLRLARPTGDANYLTLHANRDDFHVSVPLRAVRSEAIVVYRLGDRPLAPEQGGPIRFIIRDPAACHTDELDDCANVKYLDRIELSVRRGRDTRPVDDAAHAALHAQQDD
jgi:DMSO/TMAO reductase YedYZ molybdopterin-dependent catalytic subunit